MTAALLASAHAKLAALEWPPLDPLPALEQSKPEPYPFHGLGAISHLAGLAICRGVQAPDALVGGSVLAACALAAQPHADVVLPHGQRAPLSLYVVTSAASGERKSAVDAVVNRPIEDVRRQQAREQDDDKPRSLIVGRATVEGLFSLLRNQSHAGIFSPEGGEVLGGHSLREERRSAGLAVLLKAWTGEVLDTLTRSDGLKVLAGRRISASFLVQPILLHALLADPLAQGQGLIARCLVAEPAGLAGSRLYRDDNPLEDPHVQRFHAALRTLLETPPQLHPDGDGCELMPREIRLSPPARALWIELYNQIERDQSPDGPLAGVRAFASKAAEQAARIAGALTLLANPGASTIDEETMRGAADVVEFYLGEHVRLMGAGQAEAQLDRLHALLAFLLERPRTLHVDVLQRAPRKVRDLKAEGLRSLLGELVERGYIKQDGPSWITRPSNTIREVAL